MRRLAADAVANGNQQEASQLMHHWNRESGNVLGELMSIGALNVGIIQRLTFSQKEMAKVFSGVSAEASAFEQAGERLSQGPAAFQRLLPGG